MVIWIIYIMFQMTYCGLEESKLANLETNKLCDFASLRAKKSAQEKQNLCESLRKTSISLRYKTSKFHTKNIEN